MRALLLSSCLFLAACGQSLPAEPGPQTADAASPVGQTVDVPAVVETVVADNPTVDADDPVLWADAADPTRALWFGTDKSIGLYVHDMTGKAVQFFDDGPVNNIDLRNFPVGDRQMLLVAGSERKRFGVMTWLLDPATLKVERWGFMPTARDFGEPYGFCMGQFGGETFLIPNNKDGVVNAYVVTATANGPAMTLRHSWKLGSQTEGCVVNDETGDLYVGEEDVAIWRMSLGAADTAPVQVAAVDDARLVADVEGLALMRDAGRSFLIASSQGDSAFPVWQVDGGTYRYVGRFRVRGGAIDPVTQTDGVSAWSGPIAGYPEGAIAMHDHCDGDGPDDPPAAICDGDGQQQNYKLVDWRDVKLALGIR